MTTPIRFRRRGCSYHTDRYITRWGGAGICPKLDHSTTPATVTDQWVVFACGFRFDRVTHATTREAMKRARTILTVLAAAETRDELERIAHAAGGRH